MGIFGKRKNKGHYNILTGDYVPSFLPSFGMGLHTFVTTDYRMNKPEEIRSFYEKAEEKLSEIMATCDRHSAGNECDCYIDSATEHNWALHQAEVAEHEAQIARIRSAIQMRKEDLDRIIGPLQDRADKLRGEIQPLESLRAQFQIHLGSRSLSIGLPITILAMIVDAIVNLSYLQTVLLSNSILLFITVMGMSVASDLSMWALGTFLSQKQEKFVSKPLFYAICAGLLSMFLLSVVSSVMIRFGSMDITFASIGGDGELIAKTAPYTLAEYGITLITSFLTTATGLLSFAFSLDSTAYLVSVRERKERELEQCTARLEPLLNERAQLEEVQDPRLRDEGMRTAAEHQIEALRRGLKLHVRKLMTVQNKDADFTQQMGQSGRQVMTESLPDAPRSASTISLTRAG